MNHDAQQVAKIEADAAREGYRRFTVSLSERARVLSAAR